MRLVADHLRGNLVGAGYGPAVMSSSVLGVRSDARARAEPVRPRRSLPGSMSALVALTTLFTIELVRVAPALVPLHLRGEIADGSVAAVNSLPFLLPALVLVVLVRRWPRLGLVGSATVLVVARMALQLVDGPAAVGAATVGLAAGLIVLGLLSTIGLPLLGAGVLAGTALDAALHVALASRHLVWVESRWAVAVVAAVAVWIVLLVVDRARRPVVVVPRRWRGALPLAMTGPVLVVESFMLVNLGWLGQVTTLGWFASSVVAGFGAAVGVGSALWVARNPASRWQSAALIGGVGLGGLALAGAAPGPWWALAVLAAQMGIGVCLTTAGSRVGPSGSVFGPLLAVAGGHVVALGAVTVLDGRGVLGVPLPAASVLLVGSVSLVAGAWLIGGVRPPRPHRPGRGDLVSMVGVLLVPAGLLVVGVPVLVPQGGVQPVGGELRVVTYNVGLAFDLEGRLNLDEVATTLDALAPDVVSLQEVPRGHLPSGGVDMVGWLQRRLGMPHVVFQPAAPDALHGNAVLSRHPLGRVDEHVFERVGTSLPRGAVAVEVLLDGREPLVVVGAHLPPGGTLPVRAARVEGILGLWDRRPRTVIAADLNSQPGSDILDRFANAGFASAWDPAEGPGHTFPADAPRARIDWVLHTPDLVVTDAVVGDSLASDHRPLLAVIEMW